ncbi:alpha/beta fold hydrolase [Sulfobacillus harzensis]|uniref:Alpha/beta hydrolase n=1 Tax=Sulfobacillus harzensis TaxID=2729629 RepID=A0A7Y0L490_9FIRM|nr:alpha/beta hydrolase [Sulfobacillus harzensis]NMP22125.1 alpha/beta hydrolase [Sulfobacillus harzensis]
MDPDFPVNTGVLQNGMRLAYIETGSGEPVTLWIHGMGSYSETFHHLFKAPDLAGRHIAPDMPGFGHSDHLPRVHTLNDYVEAVVGLMDALNIPRAIIAGHSFGGMVAGETVIRHPERVDGVLFVSSAGWFFPENAMAPTPYPWINRIGIWFTGMEFFGRRMMQALGVNPDTLSKADRRRFQWGWRHAYEMARMGRFYDSPRFADRVVASGRPLYAIHGSRDLLFPISRVKEAISDRFPLKIIEGAGHVPFYSHPNEFNRALADGFSHLGASPHNGSQ